MSRTSAHEATCKPGLQVQTEESGGRSPRRSHLRRWARKRVDFPGKAVVAFFATTALLATVAKNATVGRPMQEVPAGRSDRAKVMMGSNDAT